jgi:hypothetical protein
MVINQRYLPWSASPTGGQLSRNATTKQVSEITPIAPMGMLDPFHRRWQTIQTMSHTAIAVVLTPDSGPVGEYQLKAWAIAGTASPNQAHMLTETQPTPAARMAAAAAPLGREG